MMEYREVYFRIRSAYQYDSGWPDKGAERAFREESRRLFQSAGWELHPAREDSGSSDTVTKGQQDLYLHPMNFSGVIRIDEIPQLQALLRGRRPSNARGWTATSGTGSSQTRSIWHSWRPGARRS